MRAAARTSWSGPTSSSRTEADGDQRKSISGSHRCRSQDLRGIGLQPAEIVADAPRGDDLVRPDQHPARTIQAIAPANPAGGITAAVKREDLQPIADIRGAVEGERPLLVLEQQQAVTRLAEIRAQAP